MKNFDAGAEEEPQADAEIVYKKHSKGFKKGYRIMYFTIFMIIVLSLVVYFQDHSAEALEKAGRDRDETPDIKPRHHNDTKPDVKPDQNTTTPDQPKKEDDNTKEPAKNET